MSTLGVDADAGSAYFPPELVAFVCIGLRENRRAVGWLEQACDNGSRIISLLPVEPMFDPPRQMPEFRNLLARGNHRDEELR